MKKLICFDIDGTLTGIKKRHHIYDSTKKALQELKKNGHIVALATGRACFRALEFQEQIEIDHMVCEGGNCLVFNKKVIWYEYPNQDECIRICEKAIEKNIGIAISFDDSKVRYSPNSIFVDTASNYGEFMDVIVDPNLDIYKKKIRRIFLILPLSQLYEVGGLKHLGVMSYHDDNFLIIEPDDKFKGIHCLAERYNISKENIVVFGDGLNDRKMFENAGFSIAMGNAIEELKAIADYVTADCDSDGIYQACLHFGWI